jgi:hypothetical protein
MNKEGRAAAEASVEEQAGTWVRWDANAAEGQFTDIEVQFRAFGTKNPPETLPTRELRNEFYLTRLAFLKETGEARSFHDLGRIRDAARAFAHWMEIFSERVVTEVKRSQCRHGHDSRTCEDCHAEQDYLQAVREGRV